MKRLTLTILLIIASVLLPFISPAQTAPNIKTETGTLNNAPYRIDMPDNWNGILLMYYHGYAVEAAKFEKDKPNEIGSGLASLGFAVAQSGYSQYGWVLEQAIPETETLRLYTVAHYGQPKETYVLGHSMGGLLTAATIESYPNRYDGALALCGLLQPTTWAMDRAGAMRAAFDYYYPGLLPGPVNIPANVALDKPLIDKVLQALPTNPKGQAELLALGHQKSVDDLADGAVFGTFILRDMEQKTGASILNNANFIYAGGPDDNALNDGVKRYTAPDASLGYLRTWYTPTGVLEKPMLAVHTTYDPLIFPETVSLYADQVQRSGFSRNFVQQYVKEDGHCHISGPETAVALQELIQWKHTGVKPKAGIVPVPPDAR